MRAVLASVLMGLFLTLCASANATTVHHHWKSRHLVARPNQGSAFGPAFSSFAYAPARPPVRYDDTPSYNDPSKFGGQSLGIDP